MLKSFSHNLTANLFAQIWREVVGVDAFDGRRIRRSGLWRPVQPGAAQDAKLERRRHRRVRRRLRQNKSQV
jgi:hypothetical protein